MSDEQAEIWGKPFQSFSTDAIHAGQEPEQWKSMMVVPPITLSATYKQHSPGDYEAFDYSRNGNPSRKCLETCVAALEDGKHGLAFSSGISAIVTIIHLLKSGDHVISTDDIYGGTNCYFLKIASKFNIEFSFVDFTDVTNVQKALKENTKVIWVETPTNPTMKVTDIQAVADIIKDRDDCFMVVDNTFMSSYFQRPLQFGADVVMHSASKYMNGHSDVVMGLLVTNNTELYKKLYFLQIAMGPVPSPFDCFLVNRGLKTLAVRMERHQKNAMIVAKYLESSPYVAKIKYPGLPSHPQFEIMKKQATGCSGMIGVWLKGDLEATKTFLSALKVFTLAGSLGGFGSLAEHPVIMSHAPVPADQRVALGITDNLVRLSVGIEDADDLVNDLEQALKNAVKSS